MPLPAALQRLLPISTEHALIGVGLALVLALLCTFGLVIDASVRQADRTKSAALSAWRTRMACESLPLLRARLSCTAAAARSERDSSLIERAFAQ